MKIYRISTVHTHRWAQKCIIISTGVLDTVWFLAQILY